MATELAPFNITVNTVAPGWIPTDRHQNDSQEDKDAYLATIPLARWGSRKMLEMRSDISLRMKRLS